jgi:hypothetical protein
MLSATKLYSLMLLVCVALFVNPGFTETPPPVAINGAFDPDLADVKPAAMQAIKDALAKAKRSHRSGTRGG